MDLGLNDLKCLISGSSRGIGRAVAEVFLAEGAQVGLTGRNEASLNQTRIELADKFGAGNVRAYQADMTDRQKVESVIAEFCEYYGRLDISIPNVGPAAGPGGASSWNALLESNLMAAVYLLEASLPQLRATKGSAVVVSSIAGLEALGAPTAYVAAKLALLGVVKELARKEAATGVRINAIAPGNVLTIGGAWEAKLARDTDTVTKYIESEVPMKRFGTPDEIAVAVAFLAAPVSSFTTGACLVVDGGQTRRII